MTAKQIDFAWLSLALLQQAQIRIRPAQERNETMTAKQIDPAAAKVALLRAKAGLDQAAAAERLGWEKKTLVALERGKAIPTPEQRDALKGLAKKLERELGITRGPGRPPVTEERPSLELRRRVDKDFFAWVERQGGQDWIFGLVEAAYLKENQC